MIKSACVVAGTILISGPSIAQKLDRVGVMEAVRQDCPRQFLPDKALIDALLLGGGSFSKFCECVAARVARLVLKPRPALHCLEHPLLGLPPVFLARHIRSGRRAEARLSSSREPRPGAGRILPEA